MDYLYLSCVIFLIRGIRGQVEQLFPPENKAILATQNVRFECQVVQNTGLPDYINWDECITKSTEDGCRRISTDDNVIYGPNGGDPVRGARYSIVTGAIGVYNLNIDGTVLEEDAGTYVCRSATDAAFLGYAELILLDGDTTCSRNVTSNQVVQGQFVKHSCEISYRGRWAPVISWSQGGTPVNGVIDESENNIARYSFVMEMMPEHDGHIYSSRTYFEAPTDTGEDEASNAPSYSFPFTFDPLTVFFPPNEISINWDEGCIAVGTTLVCNANGNPAPDYQWIDLNTSNIISPNKNLEVTEEMLGTQQYQCRAYNNYGDHRETINIQVCTTTTTTTTTTTPPPTTTVVTTTVASSTTPGVGPTEGESNDGDNPLSAGAIGGICAAAVVIVIAIIVILVCCCRGKDKEKEKKANETRPKPVHGPDVIRNPETPPQKNNMLPDPYDRGPYPDDKVGHEPGPYGDPYKRAGPYDVEVPPYEDVDDRKNRNVENLTYADLALEDIPRSRKPIQVLDPTEYAEIRMDDGGRPETKAPYPSPRHDNLVGSGMHPPSPSFRKRPPQRQGSNSPSRTPSRTPSRNNSNASFTKDLSLPPAPPDPLDRSDSLDSNSARREPLIGGGSDPDSRYPNGYDSVDIPIPKPRPPRTKPQPSPRSQRSLDRGSPRTPRAVDSSPRSQRSRTPRSPPGPESRSPQGQGPPTAERGSRSPGRSPFAPTLSQNAMNELEFRLNNPVYGARNMSEV